MAKAKTGKKPKSTLQISREQTAAKKASRASIKKNKAQGNIQKSARVAKARSGR